MKRYILPFVIILAASLYSCENSTTQKTAELAEKISLDDTWKHLEQMQEIAIKKQEKRYYTNNY